VAVQLGLLSLRELPVRLDIGRIFDLSPLLADLDCSPTSVASASGAKVDRRPNRLVRTTAHSGRPVSLSR
jgi:hypothetical protein